MTLPHLANVWISRTVVFTIHAGALLLVLYSGFSWVALAVCVLLYLIRGFGITGGYHRLFSHRSYKTSRFGQTIIAAIGTTAVEGGPISWSLNHRHHHAESDQPGDLHSPRTPRSFWWAHLGWILSSEVPPAPTKHTRDLEKFPELVWVERLQLVFIGALIAGLYWLGSALGEEWHTSGVQMVAYGFFLSTVIVWHITWLVNSATHTHGTRRYETADDSRNNPAVGILALGEGHHNNHHKHQSYCRQGLLWYEFDLTYYILRALAVLGLVWDLNEPEKEVFDIARAIDKMRLELAAQGVGEQDIVARITEVEAALTKAATRVAQDRRDLERKFQRQLAELTKVEQVEGTA